MSKKITILSLFAGRWHTLEPYLYGLTELDWPVKDLKLLWYTNAQDRFVNCLEWQKKSLEKAGYNIRIVSDQSLPQAHRVFHDGDQRMGEHLNAIATLYNAAWQYVDTDDVLFYEDDVMIPSHSLKRLTKILAKDPTASVASSCTFDRHHHGVIFVWDIVAVPVPKKATQYKLINVAQPWGIRKVCATSFSCTLIRKSRLPRVLKRRFPFRATNPRRTHKHIGGCDLVFCQENIWGGRSVYVDFDVRPYHIDAQARIH